MLEFIAIGPGVKQRWVRPVPAGREIRLGRSPKDGWAVPWDPRISREHADLLLAGDRLQVRCLEAARNSLHLRDAALRECTIGPGEEFRIGHTTFRLQVAAGEAAADAAPSSGASSGAVDLRGLAEKPVEERLRELLAHLADGEPAAVPAAAVAEASARPTDHDPNLLLAEAAALRDQVAALQRKLEEKSAGTAADQPEPRQRAADSSVLAQSTVGERKPRGEPPREEPPHEQPVSPPRPEEARPPKGTTACEIPRAVAERPDAALSPAAQGAAVQNPAEQTAGANSTSRRTPSLPTPPVLPRRPAAGESRAPSAMPPVSPKAPTSESERGVVETELGLAESPPGASPAAADDLSGLAFGQYELLDQIHRGGTGQVILARHQYTEHRAAIQVLSRSRSQSAEAVARFRQKCRILLQNRHPHIVGAFDAGVLHGVHYAILEFCPGSVVEQLKQCETLDLGVALTIVWQTGMALEHAHRRGIVHRNVHPGHLLADTEGAVKLIGWNLALQSGDDTAAAFEQPGKPLGLVDYIAPEQIADSRRVDARADVFSLGCTLFALLTKRVLHPVAWMQRKITSQCHQPAPSLRELRPDVSEKLEAVYQRMVAKNRKARFASMTECLDALSDAS